VFGYYTDDGGSTLTVLMVRNGAITDRDKFFFRADEIFDSESITSFMIRFYDMCDFIPKTVISDYELEEEDRAFLEKYLSEKNGSKINVRVPQVGDKKKLARMASENALELTKVYREEITRDNDFLLKITKLLGLELVPERIEAYDASNSGEENTTVGMIVLENGKFAKKKYRSFGIKTTFSDDYGAIREAVIRRMDHKNDDGWELPDLMLIDGGVGHVGVVKQTLRDIGIDLPVLGMVKDDHHKTRTLTDGENEISIANIKDVFTFFYKIQEEVHRFTLSRMDTKRRKAVKKSSLEEIEGIGEKKAKILNGRFGGLRGIKEASLDELMTVKGLTERDATRVYSYFHKEENGEIK
jgi:excinuclease ABC subunit C